MDQEQRQEVVRLSQHGEELSPEWQLEAAQRAVAMRTTTASAMCRLTGPRAVRRSW